MKWSRGWTKCQLVGKALLIWSGKAYFSSLSTLSFSPMHVGVANKVESFTLLIGRYEDSLFLLFSLGC